MNGKDKRNCVISTSSSDEGQKQLRGLRAFDLHLEMIGTGVVLHQTRDRYQGQIQELLVSPLPPPAPANT